MDIDVACVCDAESRQGFARELRRAGFTPHFHQLSQQQEQPCGRPRILFLKSGDIQSAAEVLAGHNLVFDLLVTRSLAALERPEMLARCGAVLSSPWDRQTLSDALADTLAGADEQELPSSALAMNFIGESEPVYKLLRVIDRVARYDAPVLVSGETGTGKELVARGIHYESKRRDFPFVPVNCGALTDELLISELFGHESGAFTDAKRQRAGLVQQAFQGTLFLDEVDSLSLRAQTSLLRFIQEQEYRPLGSEKVLRSDVRIVCATNQNLRELVDCGQFREDLFYRLKILDIRTPALRERREDILLLVEHFLHKVSQKYAERNKILHPLTERWMTREYDWPGNVRELENYVHRIFILSKSRTIYVPEVLGLPINIKRFKPKPSQGNVTQIGRFQDEKASQISRFEREYLSTLMKYSSGNVSEAARIAGKERRALGKLLKKHGIDSRQYRKLSL